ncbi:MAG: RNA polymerase subunit sigma [Rhodovulum sp.]|uniref:RNA polymerase sigma factor n=1 Tax=Rhodovulum sp. FJ3 TaxID=3079053 RepID=UPI000C0B35A6|nr:RNA polymerase sigma factor [Rhodovulum sp. FJ3]MAY32757.1 RNA polymerase subunit sigma [Rhodovulum sp.]MDV4166929.1 RNA polymerase sigma factor [Rhodovulum sp. FJ3]|tara:strand:- start:644 stop:1228 length:585 start_codon:yes stop_codon:yes gene_type:complete
MNMALDQMNEMSDETLLDLYGQGDPAAARALTLRLTPRVLGYAARLLTDRAEAEDVTQEAMLRLWKMAPDWRSGEAKVSTWLYRVVTNLCTDRLRRTRGVDIDAVPEPEDDQPAADERLQQATRMAALDKALATLPDRQREAVVLRHIEGLSNPEIAEILDISVEAVESLTARGKRALAAALSDQREELGYSNG